MRTITCLLLLIQTGFTIAQTKTVVTPFGEKVTIHTNTNNGLTAENGNIQLGGDLIKASTLTTTSTNTLAIKGLMKSTDTNDSPMVLTSDGILKKGAFPTVNIVPADIGTVIAIGGKLEVAQEITALMSADFSMAAVGTNNIPYQIGNITNILINNNNTFTSNATSNSFKVTTNGVYSVNMNVMTIVPSGTPAIGIWCDTDNKWVARINQANGGGITLNTAIDLEAAKTYSFRAGNTDNLKIEAFNSGTTGKGPSAFFSIKRLK